MENRALCLGAWKQKFQASVLEKEEEFLAPGKK
jgi:hypothetical protein